MSKEKVKQLARMCSVKIYKNGDNMDLAGGGILLRGALNFSLGVKKKFTVGLTQN